MLPGSCTGPQEARSRALGRRSRAPTLPPGPASDALPPPVGPGRGAKVLGHPSAPAPLPCVRAPHQPNPPRRHARLPSLTSRRLRQAPAPVPGGRQGAATLPRHGRAARVRRPVRAAVAPRTLHVPECEGPAHQHRSVSAVARGGRGPRRARPPAGLWGSSHVRLAERPQFACPKQDRGEARHGPEREGYPGSRRGASCVAGSGLRPGRATRQRGPRPARPGGRGDGPRQGWDLPPNPEEPPSPSCLGRAIPVCRARPVRSPRGRGTRPGRCRKPASTPRASKSTSSPAKGGKQQGNGDLWGPVG